MSVMRPFMRFIAAQRPIDMRHNNRELNAGNSTIKSTTRPAMRNYCKLIVIVIVDDCLS